MTWVLVAIVNGPLVESTQRDDASPDDQTEVIGPGQEGIVATGNESTSLHMLLVSKCLYHCLGLVFGGWEGLSRATEQPYGAAEQPFGTAVQPYGAAVQLSQGRATGQRR